MILENFEPYITVLDSSEPNLLFPILFLIIGLLGVVLCVISFTKFGDDIKLGPRFFFLGLILSVTGSVVGFANLPYDNTKTTTNVEGVKLWAEETYLVTFDDTEANRLIEGSSNYDEDKGIQNTSEAIGKYYGKNIMVFLVKYENEWRLFSNSEELPKVEK
jgi:hypothetical protein